jgi:hypothetical protein
MARCSRWVKSWLWAVAALALITSGTGAFQPIAPTVGGLHNGALPYVQRSTRVSTQLYMGGKMAKFGIFSPAVYAGKIVLGNDRLNKIRGKAISLHSQYIGEFCEWAGAYHLRTRLIKKAKTNGDTLGFLV